MNSLKLENAYVGLETPASGVYVCTGFSIHERKPGVVVYLIGLKGSQEELTAILFSTGVLSPAFIDNQVSVTFRTEIYSGTTVVVIDTITKQTIVKTLEKEEGIRLYLPGIKENKSTVSFSEITNSNPINSCIIYIQDSALRKSQNATWVVIKGIDRDGRREDIRRFSPEPGDEYVVKDGYYAEVSLSRDDYGLRTDYIIPAPQMGTAFDTTYVVLKNFINQILDELGGDWKALAETAKFTDRLFKVDSGRTLHLVAKSLSMTEQATNSSSILDTSRVRKCILSAFIHHAMDSGLPRDVAALNILMRAKLLEDGVAQMFAGNDETVTADVIVAKAIIEMMTIVVDTETTHKPMSRVVSYESLLHR